MSILIHPFPPVADNDSEILILGSFPSVKSREDGFYYAHPRNRFWPMMEEIYAHPVSTREEKIELLRENHIALWDSIGECSIQGSADSAITDEKPNDIRSLIERTTIRKIITNGAKSFDVYMKYVYPDTNIIPIKLPSTSPANAQYSFQKLTMIWREALFGTTKS